MPNTIQKKRLRVRKNVDSPWIDIPAIVSTPVGQMAFVSFEINADGNLIINHAERLGSTSFRLTDAGNLEVELNGSN